MEFVTTVVSFILVLGVLVTVHELGHFLAARLTSTYAEVFAIGMGNRVIGFNKLHGIQLGALSEQQEQEIVRAKVTDYRIALLPIGGYVKIAGMIDESMDTNYLASEPQPWEFRSKNAAQKIFIMSAGVLMNIVLAILIFASIAMIDGKTVVDTTTVAHVESNSIAEALGIKAGDKIISINSEALRSWSEMSIVLTKNVGNDIQIIVERSGASIPLRTPAKTLVDALAAQRPLGWIPLGSAVLITGVESLKPAGKLGLMAGDTILSFNGVPIASPAQFAELVRAHKGKEITLEWKRIGSVMSGQIIPDVDGRIGVSLMSVFRGTIRKERYGFFESFAVGTQEMVTTIGMYIASVAQIFKGRVSLKQSVGGPIQIAKMSAQAAELGILPLLRWMALLSIILAVMNILPIPALDGGHIMFILVELVIRREIPAKVKLVIQQAGIIMLIVFMVFVFYNDLTR
ncbi:MAG: RIP metalloprotease RseP [Bacteroidota bacterium]|nr:RIP metalloprotease RseP [Candidatus Kapabacteria bacterium]MDW8219976.1 RIP metalloprotease RseP [Bacteroidota bacterium]